jgi:hypothetical protein
MTNTAAASSGVALPEEDAASWQKLGAFAQAREAEAPSASSFSEPGK